MNNKRLERELGVSAATMLGLGSIVGTGVFVSIGIAAGIAGPSVIISLAIAAAVATCNVLFSCLAALRSKARRTQSYYQIRTAPLIL